MLCNHGKGIENIVNSYATRIKQSFKTITTPETPEIMHSVHTINQYN